MQRHLNPTRGFFCPGHHHYTLLLNPISGVLKFGIVICKKGITPIFFVSCCLSGRYKLGVTPLSLACPGPIPAMILLEIEWSHPEILEHLLRSVDTSILRNVYVSLITNRVTNGYQIGVFTDTTFKCRTLAVIVKACNPTH
jgi:hypothetical protein